MGKSSSDISYKETFNLISQEYEKANNLINAVGPANELVQKLTVLSISVAKEEVIDGKTKLVATMMGKDLKKILKKTNNSFYEQVKTLTAKRADKQSLLDYYLLIYNDEEESVTGINVVEKVEFKNGIFKMIFTDAIKPYIWGLKDNYTKLSLADALSLDIYSFRIYELLKSEYDYREWEAKNRYHNYEPNSTYYVRYDLIDLQLKIGLIDATRDDRITKELKNTTPDFDKIRGYLRENEQKEKEREADPKRRKYIQKYRTWNAFKTKVLVPAQNGLKEKSSSIVFDFDPGRSGRGGLVTEVIFSISNKVRVEEKTRETEIDENITVVDEPVQITEAERFTVFFKTQTLLGTSLFSVEEIMMFMEDAKYDYDKIETAYKVLQSQKNTVPNPVGFMRDAIKNSWSIPAPMQRSKKNNFVNFPQNTYDFDELEEKLLDN